MIRRRCFSKFCITILLTVVILLSMVGCGTTESEQSVSDPTGNTVVIPDAAENTPTEESSEEVSNLGIVPEEIPGSSVTVSDEGDAESADSELSFAVTTEEPAEESIQEQTTAPSIEPTFTPEPPIEPTPTAELTPTEIEDTTLDDELNELAAMDTDELTPTQRNAINMLNYMTVLTQEINAAPQSRLILDAADSELYNNIYPNAVDTKTQTQITNMLNTIHKCQMITVKRERLEYIYEKNQAQALRSAIPSPVALLSVVQSGSLLKAAASVLYMAVDSVSSYEAASSQAELQYLQSGWELDDEEFDAIQDSRINALNYMFNMVRDNSIPGDYALNAESVQNFVSWKNNTNLVRKIAWLEANQRTYQEFGPYWLELAKDYYDAEDYENCLNAFTEYEEVTTRIFRKDYDYAEALPMAIIAAKESMRTKDYITFADEYTQVILDNTNDTDWQLRYFVAQIYLDLYAASKDSAYIDKAYKIVFDNVNVLVDEQKALNATYLAEVQKVTTEKGATKQQKEDAKQYNKLLEAERKAALPPVSEALYLNCDLLFMLAEERDISAKEQNQIDSILHENGECIFLTTALDERFRFNSTGAEFDADEITIKFDGDELEIPAFCVTDRSIISITVTGPNGKTVIDDWVVDEVERPKNADCSDFIVTYTSKKADDYDYAVGETITITVVPVAESPDKVITYNSVVVADKKLFVFNGITVERK